MPKSPAKRISYLEGITLKAATLLTHLRRDHGTAFTPAQHIRIRATVAECKQIERNALERVAREAIAKGDSANDHIAGTRNMPLKPTSGGALHHT